MGCGVLAGFGIGRLVGHAWDRGPARTIAGAVVTVLGVVLELRDGTDLARGGTGTSTATCRHVPLCEILVLRSKVLACPRDGPPDGGSAVLMTGPVAAARSRI